ncbi:MAG: crossover junction endodeoxyribonuclease RuvC, partial [Actinomycetota bacterium]
ALIADLRPDVVAVERVLFQHNVSTAMGVGMASGLAMAEAVAAGCDVAEYSPNEIKQAVAGYGSAGKHEIGEMVQTLLGLSKKLSPVDAADATAVALCHLARVPGRRTRASVASSTASTKASQP